MSLCHGVTRGKGGRERRPGNPQINLSSFAVFFPSFSSFFLSFVITCPCVGIHYLVCAETSVDGGGPYQAGGA